MEVLRSKNHFVSRAMTLLGEMKFLGSASPRRHAGGQSLHPISCRDVVTKRVLSLGHSSLLTNLHTQAETLWCIAEYPPAHALSRPPKTDLADQRDPVLRQSDGYLPTGTSAHLHAVSRPRLQDDAVCALQSRCDVHRAVAAFINGPFWRSVDHFLHQSKPGIRDLSDPNPLPSPLVVGGSNSNRELGSGLRVLVPNVDSPFGKQTRPATFHRTVSQPRLTCWFLYRYSRVDSSFPARRVGHGCFSLSHFSV
ncbi:hypothetical protein LZ30DRAFT_361570 [Colletotrichum cereale]|nr:hypothetical protein LZ30DRAFT_361570 [Colletotrichum cereale]